MEPNIDLIIMNFIDNRVTDYLLYHRYMAVLGFVWYYAVAYIFIMLIQYSFCATFRKAADKIQNQPLRSMLLGMLFFILVPVVALLLMATLVGIPFGLLLLLAYLILVLLVVFISSVSVANWINRLTKLNWGFWLLSVLALVVYIFINLLLMVPVVGLIVLAVLSCLAYGSILINIRWQSIEKRIEESFKSSFLDN